MWGGVYGKKMINGTFWRFILVGIINTLFGTIIMFGFYNYLHFNYWISSMLNYVFSSILSYFLNKNFTFRNKEKGWCPAVRFAINISVCYLLAYGIAKPFVYRIFVDYSMVFRDNISMLVGMALFVIFNYLGQRFFAFRNSKISHC